MGAGDTVSSCDNYPGCDYYQIMAMQQQQQQQYRDPPPYPGNSKQLFQPGGRQSFSGSETSTDVSVSSMENLATSMRQEPQGEENQSQNIYNQLDLNNSDGGYSILARLGMPTACVSDSKLSSVPAYFVSGPSGGQVYTTHSEPSVMYNPVGQIPHWQAGQQPSPQSVPRTPECNRAPISTFHGSAPYVNSQWIHDPVDLSQNHHMMSYLANLPPPPEYPGPKLPDPPVKKEMCHAFELSDNTNKGELSRSQPDLSRINESQTKTQLSNPDLKIHASTRLDMSSDSSSKITDIDQTEIVTRATQLVEMLSKENRTLLNQLTECNKKISKLQKLELEIEKVHTAYESLSKSAQKREKLDTALKHKLEMEIKKLTSENKNLKDQIEKSVVPDQKQTSKSESEIKSKLSEKDTTIIKLLSHNKDLLSMKEKLEQQVTALKSTVTEQRAQIDVLDNALTTVQANVHLEEEGGKKEAYSNRVDQLQTAFTSLQSATERREQKEKQLRQRLEKEIDTLRKQLKALPGKRQDSNPETNDVATLKRMINEKDARILDLETEIVKWEQKFLQESTMRQLALEDSSHPKFAAIEKSSTETEALINEAKMEKLRHMEELYQANKHVAELEARVRTLQSQLSEKEAMVKVYQRSPLTRSSSVQMLYCSPLHSPRPSLLATPNLSHQSSHSDSSNYVRHVKTGSESALDTDRHVALEDELREKLDSIETEKKVKVNEDECRLWHV